MPRIGFPHGKPPQFRPSYLTVVVKAVFLFFLTAGLVHAEPATIKSYRSPTEVQRSQAPGKWFPVRVGLTLNEGDVLRTGKNGKAEIKLSDGSKMAMGPESEMQVKESGANRIFGLSFLRFFVCVL